MQMTHDLHRNDGKTRGGCDGDGVKARLYIADIANHSFLQSPQGTLRPLNFCLFVWLHLMALWLKVHFDLGYEQ